MGRIYLSNMRREFHNLKQRQMSVTECQREFTRLSKYAPEMLVTEEEKCRKFEDGLNDHIRAHVTGFCHDDFSKIVTCALNDSHVLISTRVRNSEDHKVLISLQLKDQLRLPVVRLFYRHHQLLVH